MKTERESLGGGATYAKHSKFTLHCLTELVSLFEGPASDRGASTGSCCGRIKDAWCYFLKYLCGRSRKSNMRTCTCMYNNGNNIHVRFVLPLKTVYTLLHIRMCTCWLFSVAFFSSSSMILSSLLSRVSILSSSLANVSCKNQT